MSVLPPGWIEVPLDAIAETRLGKMLSKKSKTGVGSRPYLRNKNVQWGHFDLDDVAVMDFTGEEFERFRLVPGDLLVCEGGEVGRAAIWRGAIRDCAYQKALHRIRTSAGLLPEYLLYLLMHYQTSNVLERFVTGSTISHLPQEDLRTIPVPLPPAAEQRRIVDVIEEQFSRLDVAEESLRRAQRNLGRYRLATLLSEMDGKWERRPLGELLVSLRNGLFISRPAAEPPGTPIFRISAVRPMSLDVQDVRYAPVDETHAAGYFVEEGDLLFTRYSGNPSFVGACARVPHLERPTLHPDKLIKAVVNTSVVDSAYLEIALSVGEAHEEIEKRRKTTAGQVGISGGQLKTVLVPTPTLNIQREIAANVARQASVSEALDRDLTTSLQRTKRLRSAVLEEAFAGRLVTQDTSGELTSTSREAVKT